NSGRPASGATDLSGLVFYAWCGGFRGHAAVHFGELLEAKSQFSHVLSCFCASPMRAPIGTGPDWNRAFPDDWITPGRFAIFLALLVFAAYPEVVLGLGTFFFR